MSPETEPQTAAGRALAITHPKLAHRAVAIEAEACTAALDEARAAARDAKFPKQYTLDESESAHVTFLLGAQEIQTAILAAIDALRGDADKS